MRHPRWLWATLTGMTVHMEHTRYPGITFCGFRIHRQATVWEKAHSDHCQNCTNSERKWERD